MDKKHIECIRGDITKLEVDVIVNAANIKLIGGGGVDGAIHRAGGPEIMYECDRIRQEKGGCPTGEAVYTRAGNLPAKYVIHTVGPVYDYSSPDQNRTLLASCYRSSISLAKQLNVKSIAFPNISTGVYGYPKEEAAHVALEALGQALQEPGSIEKVVVVCFDEENYDLYRALLT